MSCSDGASLQSDGRRANFWKTPFGTSISFSGYEAALLAHKMGIDVREAIDAPATKPLGFIKVYTEASVRRHFSTH